MPYTTSSPAEVQYDRHRALFLLARLKYNRALLELQKSYGESAGNDSFDDTLYEINDDQSSLRAIIGISH